YIGEANKGYVELNWIPSSSRVFRYVIIDVTSAENGFEVQEMIADAIKNAEGADGIYKVLLRGRTRRGMVDIANLSDALSHVAFYLDIVDETKPEILPEEMAKENTLRGDFAKAMLEKIQEMPDEEKEIGYLALELGLSSMERGHRA
ncbi:MAG: hypothetical protein J6A56_02400, partial [Clostridia bacterium]|nr:hypothetical protein [Clostridia bacterium]